MEGILRNRKCPRSFLLFSRLQSPDMAVDGPMEAPVAVQVLLVRSTSHLQGHQLGVLQSLQTTAINNVLGFPGGQRLEFVCQCRSSGSMPGPGRSLMRGATKPVRQSNLCARVWELQPTCTDLHSTTREAAAMEAHTTAREEPTSCKQRQPVSSSETQHSHQEISR